MFHCFKFLRDACLKSHQVVVAVFAHEGSAAVGSCRVGTVLTHYIPIGFGEECRGKHSYRDHGGKLWSYNSLKMYVKIRFIAIIKTNSHSQKKQTAFHKLKLSQNTIWLCICKSYFVNVNCYLQIYKPFFVNVN